MEKVKYLLYISFRTPIDFASASDKIWPHFAAMGIKRTSRSELVEKGVLRPVSNWTMDNLALSTVFESFCSYRERSELMMIPYLFGCKAGFSSP